MAGFSYVSHTHRLVVFWSTKCASTAVVDWFLRLIEADDTGEKREWLFEKGYRYEYRQARHLCVDRGYRSIHFTRNPYGRAVSTYLNKFVVYYGRPIDDMAGLERFSRRFIESFNELNGLARDVFHGLSFVQYLSHIEYLMTKKRVLNLHWDTQLPRDIPFRIKPDHVVRLETFRDDLLRSAKELGLPEYVPVKLNKTTFPSKFTRSTFDESATNSLNLLADGISIGQENLLTPMTAALIQRLYGEDFSFFSYSEDHPLTSLPKRKEKRKWPGNFLKRLIRR